MDDADRVLEGVGAAVLLARRQMADLVAEDGPVGVGQGQVFDHRYGRVALQARHDAAAGAVQARPPGEVVVAQVEDVGGSRLDGHGLGGGDVVHLGQRDLQIERRLGIGIVDDMGLGPVDVLGEARPLGGGAGEPYAGGVDQPHHIRRRASEPAPGQARHLGEQSGEHLMRSSRIGVGQGRARHFPRPQVIEPGRMARHRRLDLPQRDCAGQLGVEQSHQLALGAQPTNPSISAVLIHKIFERRPRDMLQKPVQHAIVVAHGVGPFSCPNHRQVFENE